MFPLRFDPESIDRPHLLTIRYSHYCELARWAMDHAGVAYTEVAYAIGCHMEPIGSLRADPGSWSEGSFAGAETGKGVERRQHGVPLVCLPGGGRLRDSWEVLEHYVAPVADAWKRRFDHELGPAARRLGYRGLLEPDRPDLADTMLEGATDAERAFLERAKPIVASTVTDLLGLTGDREAEDRVRLKAFFHELSDGLADLPPPDGGEESAAWWIACSSLSALALFPPRYAAGSWTSPPLEAFGPGLQGFVREMRATPLGQAVMGFYAERR